MLGHWCCYYKQNSKSFFNDKVLSHPWNKFATFQRDYKEIQKIYETSLLTMQEILNKLFNKNYSLRYWRILIGPWLNAIISIYYEKKLLINRSKKIKKAKIIRFKFKREDHIPYSTQDFIARTSSDEWNYYFFLDILQNSLNEKFKFKEINLFLKPKIKKNNTQNKSYFNFLSIFNSKKIFLFNTYLNKKDQIYLAFKNFFFFKSYFSVNDEKCRLDLNLRNTLIEILKKKKKKNFNLLKLIILNIPKNFLENFIKNEKIISTSFLPRYPKIIFTSAIVNDSQRQYIATCIEEGTKLVYGQHGGNYGNLRMNFSQDHECKISDKYISWGWKEKNNKIKNLGTFLDIKKINRQLDDKYKCYEKLFIVTRGERKYIANLQSSFYDIGNEHYYFFKFLPKIISSVTKAIQKKIVVRTLNTGWLQSWNFEKYLNDKFKNLIIDGRPSRSIYENYLNQSKLVVSTIFSTVFFECMLANIPVILVLPSKKIMLNNKTIKIFNKLKIANIYFSDLNSATKFINNNWDNIDKWWNSKKTQKTILIFNKNFNKKNDNLRVELQNLFEKMKKNEI